MCSGCDVEGASCTYCGAECYGTCEDPDTCPACWNDKHFDYDVDDDGEALQDCMDIGCNCSCHVELYKDLNIRFEAGVMVNGELAGPPYKHKGVFPFLSLPGEIRDKIYGYAMLQDGQQRVPGSNYHRGTIHTALLQSCRQINKEARHFPLTINILCFNGPLSALYFFAYHLPPTVASFARGIHIEYPVNKPQYEVWHLLMLELAKKDIKHLGLTIHGPLRKDLIVGHSCFAARFTPLKKLESVDLQLGSAFVTEDDRVECREYFKKQLVRGHDQSQKGKSKVKRAVVHELQPKDGQRPTKMAKKNVPDTKMMKRGSRSSAAGTRDLAFHLAQAQLQATLTAKFTLLKTYATNLDLSLVSIRLEAARKAAEAADQLRFDSLAHGIWVTLEKHYRTVHEVRQRLLDSEFPASSDPLTGVPAVSMTQTAT